MDLDHHPLPHNPILRATNRIPVHVILDPFPHLGHPVSGASNFQELFLSDVGGGGGYEEGGLFEVACGATGEVGLVLFPLRMREVGAFVGVQRQAETTFQRP
jgi:hypothetical protein